MLSLNEKLSEDQLLRLRATFHVRTHVRTSDLYARTHVKISDPFESTLRVLKMAATVYERDNCARGGGTQQIFTRGGSDPRSNPLPFIYHSKIEVLW